MRFSRKDAETQGTATADTRRSTPIDSDFEEICVHRRLSAVMFIAFALMGCVTVTVSVKTPTELGMARALVGDAATGRPSERPAGRRGDAANALGDYLRRRQRVEFGKTLLYGTIDTIWGVAAIFCPPLAFGAVTAPLARSLGAASDAEVATFTLFDSWDRLKGVEAEVVWVEGKPVVKARCEFFRESNQ